MSDTQTGPVPLRRARILVLCTLAAGVLLFLFLQSQPIDVEAHAIVVANLRRMKALEARWSEALLRSRFDAREVMSSLASIQGELEGLERTLCDGPDPVCEEGGAALLLCLSSYRDALESQRAILDPYEEYTATFKQSLRRLPGVLDAYESASHASNADHGAASEVSALVSHILVQGLLSGSDGGAGMRGDLQRLEELRKRPGGDHEELLGRLIGEVEALIANRAGADELLSRMQGIPLTMRGDALFRACNEVFDRRLTRTDLFRLLLYLYALGLLMKLFHGMHLLEKAARQLHTAKSTLEERVNERTHLLTVINAEMQGEIHERKRAEDEAQRAREAAEAANRSKSDFLANMSHEIRTPMTSILGYSERLLDKDITDSDKLDAISTIRRNGDYLLQIINDILDISKIEAGRLAIERIPCSLSQIVSEVYNAMEVRAEVKGLEFRVEYPESIPATIVTDPVRLKQVLLNLVGNAIKFTDKGSVSLCIEYAGDASPPMPGEGACVAGPCVSFAVSDTGIGMSADELDRLFRPFTQADTSTTRKFGGTGLGLSISKKLVEMMGGAITVRSRPGEGTTFTFHIGTGSLDGVPMIHAPSTPEVERRLIATGFQKPLSRLTCRVLLAEDGEDNQRLIGHILRKAGAEVKIVENGEMACHFALEALRARQPFDAVLMDMQMPVLDGYAATARLRASGYRLPIIAITANAMATDRARCLGAGCDEFCTKPIEKHKLLATIARLTGQVRGEVGSEPRTVEAAIRTGTDEGKAPMADTSKDEGLLALVRMFMDDLSADVEAMRTALASGDVATLAHIAHQLKGSAGSYGFPELGKQAARLEKCAKESAAREDLVREVNAVAELCRKARVG